MTCFGVIDVAEKGTSAAGPTTSPVEVEGFCCHVGPWVSFRMPAQ